MTNRIIDTLLIERRNKTEDKSLAQFDGKFQTSFKKLEKVSIIASVMDKAIQCVADSVADLQRIKMHRQCDQMARLFFNTGAFTTVKI